MLIVSLADCGSDNSFIKWKFMLIKMKNKEDYMDSEAKM